MRRRQMTSGLLAVGMLVATACGARVSPAARNAAATAAGLTGVRAGSGVGPASGDGSSLGPADSGPAAAGPTSGSSGSGAGASPGTQTGPGAGPALHAGNDAAPATGDNGGATDVGVTATEIMAGNVSTLSGPVPGLFKGAVDGTNAFFAYQNSLGGVYGRKLKLVVRDDQFDAGTNRAQTIDLIPKTLAMVGSFSLFDDASADAVGQSNIPDLTYSLSRARLALKNNFNPSPAQVGWRTGGLLYYKQHYPDAIKHVGTLVGDVASAKDSAAAQRGVAEKLGYVYTYSRTYEPTETDFTADVVRMRQQGVRMVLITAADVHTLARLAGAMQQQNFKPDVFATPGIAYDPQFLNLAGSAAEGIISDSQQSLYLGEDAGSNPEVALLDQWVARVDPGARPDLFAVFAWSAARLFVTALKAAGPKITRAALTSALQNIHQWDSNGLQAMADPASKTPPTCYVLIKIQGGKYTRTADDPPTGFRCDGSYMRL